MKGDNKMIKIPIDFRCTEDVVQFVQIMDGFPCDADLVSGNRMVDAKSLLGACAISQASDINLILHESSRSILDEITKSLSRYILMDTIQPVTQFS